MFYILTLTSENDRANDRASPNVKTALLWGPGKRVFTLGIVLNFDARVNNSDTAQLRVTNMKTP